MHRPHTLRGAAAPALARRQLLCGSLCLPLGALPSMVPGSVAAAEAAWPRQAVRLVVPYSVGVGPDVVARALAQVLQLRWGQPVVVDNRPGASGIVAFGEVRRTVPDGHTLYLADTATLAVNPLLQPSLPYDPERDLQPLSLLFRATFVLWVGARHRFRHMADLLAQARQAPQAVSYGALGPGHASQVAVELLAHAAGVHLLPVHFRDAGALLAAVVSGDVDFTAFSVNTVAGLLAAGRLRGLAVGADQRLDGLPDLPTLAEAGAPAVALHPWAGLVTLAGVPAPVLAQLQADIARALQSPELAAQARRAGFELTPSTPQALAEQARADRARYRVLVQAGRLGGAN